MKYSAFFTNSLFASTTSHFLFMSHTGLNTTLAYTARTNGATSYKATHFSPKYKNIESMNLQIRFRSRKILNGGTHHQLTHLAKTTHHVRSSFHQLLMWSKNHALLKSILDKIPICYFEGPRCILLVAFVHSALCIHLSKASKSFWDWESPYEALERWKKYIYLCRSGIYYYLFVDHLLPALKSTNDALRCRGYHQYRSQPRILLSWIFWCGPSMILSDTCSLFPFSKRRIF